MLTINIDIYQEFLKYKKYLREGNNMKKVMMYLLACSSMLISSMAFADSPHEFSGNVALSTDYVYRGQSQTGNDPSISGGLDYAHSSGFYLGTWASNVNFPDNVTSEIDVYGGYGGEIGGSGISYDLGILYYIYPGTPTNVDNNFIEGSLGLGYSFTDDFSVGATFRATPDWQGSTGEGYNYEGSFEYSLPADFAISASVGHQTVDENATWGSPDWTYYSVGLSKTLFGAFDASIAYVGSDLSKAECFGGVNICEDRAVFTISSSW
ncbi:MAG TPA: hypothetical protein EYQ42_08395 [Thiotrichaceae bacterium]|jgi:uncharacterized protein (TIGR02001 family)|nr:hypothetical protein [Thiotrichaceae bacterium]HIM07274.1 hypothetical protein [Gammaproteobacteria bacterium]